MPLPINQIVIGAFSLVHQNNLKIHQTIGLYIYCPAYLTIFFVFSSVVNIVDIHVLSSVIEKIYQFFTKRMIKIHMTIWCIGRVVKHVAY